MPRHLPGADRFRNAARAVIESAETHLDPERIAGEIRRVAHDAVESYDPDRVAAEVRHIGKVASVVAPFLGIEVKLPAAGVAAIIKLADERGLLDTDKAEPLREIARQIDAQIPLDEQAVLNAVPKLLELKIFTRLFGEGKAAQGIRTIAKLAVESGSVREIVRRYKERHTDGPGRELI